MAVARRISRIRGTSRRNQLTVRWLRSRNRARIQVANAKELLDVKRLHEMQDKFVEESTKAGGLQSRKELSIQLSKLVQLVQERYPQKPDNI